MVFELNERLAKGGFLVGNYGSCQLLLKNNAHFLWLILVPEVPNGEEEIHELPEKLRGEIFESIHQLSDLLKNEWQVDKVNWASIGNQVRQMHIHVVGRWENDVAWPGVVWSCSQKQVFERDKAEGIIQKLRSKLVLRE